MMFTLTIFLATRSDKTERFQKFHAVSGSQYCHANNTLLSWVARQN
jgi:hypothetical protein